MPRGNVTVITRFRSEATMFWYGFVTGAVVMLALAYAGVAIIARDWPKD